MGKIGYITVTGITLLIRVYQLVFSPWLGSRCRYTPSCSEYCIESLRMHGVKKGLILSFARLSRCHPWGKHGHDPVPE